MFDWLLDKRFTIEQVLEHDVFKVNFGSICKPLEFHEVETLVKNLSEKNVGNSKACFKLFNKYIDYNELVHLKWFTEFNNVVFNQKNIKKPLKK